MVEARIYPDTVEIWYADRKAKNCRACEVEASTGLITDTSSIGWSASRELLKTIAIGVISSLPK